MSKHVSVIAVYEQEPEYIIPSAIIQIVEDETSSVIESPFYLEMMLISELGEPESPYIIEQFVLTAEEVVTPYAKEKLIGQVYDEGNNFPVYLNIHIDEDYLNDLDEQHWGMAQ